MQPLRSLDDRRLYALGRLIEDQQLRVGGQRAADRELLLLTARQVTAAALQHLLQHGEQIEDLLGASAVRQPERGARPIIKFSSTVSRLKISRPCGT